MSKFALLFLFLFVGGIFAAVFITPVASFLVYQLVYFVNPDIRWWAATIPGIQYSFVAAILMLFILAIKYKELSFQAPWKQQPALKWLLAFLVMYIFMINFAVVPSAHKTFTFDFAKLIVIIFVAYKLINSEKALDACLWAYVLGATYIGYLAYAVGRDWQGRVEGIGMVDTGGDSNMTAAAIAPALVMLMYFAWLGNKKTKVFAVFCGAFIANGIVLINSRGSFLAIVVGASFFLFFMVFSKYQRAGQRGTAMLLIMIALAGVVYIADDAFWTRMGTLTDVEDGSASGSHRIEFWLATFEVLKDHPLGVGILGFIELSPNYLPDHYFDNRTTGKAVHSTWFQVLGEVGWVGILVFFCLIISTFKTSKKTKKKLIELKLYDCYFKVIALEGALISYLVAASFINRSRAEILYWLILFILVAFNIYVLKNVDTKPGIVRAK
ncbi:O-antigen ligase family protein [Marinobacter sp. M3C]|jgi:hypothetical protein|uniref:O-antigen ligase family protein n=1 Tax=Marinobacter sp. M3C TaxID=2917715 RepID=UPI00200DE6E1|nr:O-antigen ligase family protein [Marinobacter sp. M3C]UQG60425.1 O-antigen ligase family protein [Marinobacter sp. M3C]